MSASTVVSSPGRPRGPYRLPVPRLEPEPEWPPYPPLGDLDEDPGCVVLALPLTFPGPGWSASDRLSPRPEGAVADLPAPGPWAARLLHAIAETDDGLRPVRQLARHASEQVMDELEAAMYRRGGPHRPVRTPTERPVVGTVRVCRPSPTVAEVAATMRVAGRTTAVALRLEATERGWRCTALQRQASTAGRSSAAWGTVGPLAGPRLIAAAGPRGSA